MRSRPEALVDARVEALFLPVSFVQILEVFRYSNNHNILIIIILENDSNVKKVVIQ